MDIANESVKSIVKKASNGEINIPLFQREFRWKATQVRDLAESLYRKYPIGLILFWKSDMDVSAKTLKSRNPAWLVDGQQRVSSFCILFGIKPYWWPSTKDWNSKMKKYDVMINIETENIALANSLRKNDSKWVSFREILKVNDEKELKSISKKLSKKNSLDYADVIDVVKGVYYIKKHYDVPTLTIDHSLDEVVDIFARLNKNGTSVKEADIIKGLIAAVNQDWLKNEFEKTLEDWRSLGWNFDPIIVLRTISGIGNGKTIIKDVKNDFWEKRIDKPWKTTVHVINSVIVRFREYGLTSIDLIPSKNSLISVFILYFKFSRRGLKFNHVLYWLLLANYTERYTGAGLYAIQKDVNAILKSATFKSAMRALFKNIEEETHLKPIINLTPEMVKETSYKKSSGKIIRLLLYLAMFRKNARDWVSKTQIGYVKGAPKILENFSPEWHHIFPQNILKKYGYVNDEINSVANITVITSGSNKKFKSEPWEYIWEYKISSTLLREHLIPKQYKGWNTKMAKKDLKKIWDVKNYMDFLDERARVISREINKYVKELSQGLL